MAFGDHSRVENQIEYQGGLSQNLLNNLRDTLIPQNQNIWNRSQVANDQADRDYSGIQSGYQNLGNAYSNLGGQYGNQFNQYGSYLNGPGISYNPSQQNFGAYGGYQNFADTGGYSGQDIQNIRARSNAPMRATYQNAQNDLDRRNVIAGGNLANYGAAKAKMARDLSINLGDQSLNTEAQLAQMINQGRLAGLGGMTGIDTSRMQEGLANASGNLQGQGMNMNRILGLLSGQGNTLAGQGNALAGQGNALQGQTSLYGTTPGLANMYGNQLNQSNNNLVQSQQLQQQLAQLILNGTLGMSGVPGNFQSALGNIGSALNLGGQVAGMFGGLPGTSNTGVSGIPGGTRGPF